MIQLLGEGVTDDAEKTSMRGSSSIFTKEECEADE